MIEKLKTDITGGKIAALKLINTDIEVIKNNRDGLMFGVYRDVNKISDDYFTLKTWSNGKIVDCEAYYTAFDYYDGKFLKAGNTVYEVKQAA